MKRSLNLQQLRGQPVKYKSFPLPKGQNDFSSLPILYQADRCSVSQETSQRPHPLPPGTAPARQRRPKPLSALKDKAAAFISSCQQPPFPTWLLQTRCLVYYKECSYIVSRVHLGCSCIRCFPPFCLCLFTSGRDSPLDIPPLIIIIDFLLQNALISSL